MVSSVGGFLFDFTHTSRKGKAILIICQANFKAHMRSLHGELCPITVNNFPVVYVPPELFD